MIEHWSLIIPYPQYEVSTLNRIRLVGTTEVLIAIDDSNVEYRNESWKRVKNRPKYDISSLDRVRIHKTGEILLSTNICNVPRPKLYGGTYRACSSISTSYTEASKRKLIERELKIVRTAKPNTYRQKHSPEQPYTFTTSKRERILNSINPLTSDERNNMIKARALKVSISFFFLFSALFYFIWVYNYFTTIGGKAFGFLNALSLLILFFSVDRVHEIKYCLYKPLERWNSGRL